MIEIKDNIDAPKISKLWSIEKDTTIFLQVVL